MPFPICCRRRLCNTLALPCECVMTYTYYTACCVCVCVCAQLYIMWGHRRQARADRQLTPSTQECCCRRPIRACTRTTSSVSTRSTAQPGSASNSRSPTSTSTQADNSQSTILVHHCVVYTVTQYKTPAEKSTFFIKRTCFRRKSSFFFNEEYFINSS